MQVVFRAAPEALRNYGKPKISVFLMVSEHCTNPYRQTVANCW